jgi:hypothetical protein
MMKQEGFMSADHPSELPTVERKQDTITALSWLVGPTTVGAGLDEEVSRASELLARTLRSHRLRAQTVRLIVESPSGRSVVRRASLESRGSSAAALRRAASQLLDTLSPSLSVVSVRVVVTGLIRSEPPVQMELFRAAEVPTSDQKREGRIDRALEAVEAKVGGHVVGRGDEFSL